jgi:potassium efflux system protein
MPALSPAVETLVKISASLCTVLTALVLSFVTPALGAVIPNPPTGVPGGGTPPETSAPAVEKARPSTVPMADLVTEAERTITRLREILSTLRREVPISSLEREVPPILESISALRQSQEALQAPQLTRRAVSSLLQEWLLDDRRLAEVEASINSRLQSLLELRDEVRRTTELWERSREEIRQDSAPPALIERATTVVETAREVGEALETRLAPALALQRSVTEARLAVTEGFDWIDAASEEVYRDLLRLDSPPLWKAILAPAPAGTIGFRWGAVVETTRRALAQLARAYPIRLGWHFLAAAALLLFLLRARRRPGDGRQADPAMPGTVAGLSRPFSTTFLLALLATLGIYPRAPIAVIELAGILSVVPALLLLPPLTAPRERPALISILGLFTVHMFLARLELDPLAARLANLGLALAALAVFSWHLRPGSSFRSLPPDRLRKAAWSATWAGLAVLVASVGLNVVGNVSLARLILAATILSGYLATMMYLVALVGRGLLALAFSCRAVGSLKVIQSRGDGVRRSLDRWLELGCLLSWLYLTLEFFGLFRPGLKALSALLGRRWTVGTVTLSLGSILVFAVTLYLSVLLSRLIRFFLEGEIFPRLSLRRGIPATISAMVRYGLITGGFLLAVAAAGVDLSAFTLLAGALGVGIGFGLQTIVNNFVSGLILMFERPIQVGDVVQVGNLFGRVRHIGVRASMISTFEGADVVVPNANLISNEVVNWTLSDRLRRMEIPVGVAYGTDPARVLGLLEQAAREHPDVLKTPPPQALFLRFGDSSLDFVLRFWTLNIDEYVRIQSEVSIRIYGILQAADIRIPFPQRDLHLHVSGPAHSASKSGPEEVARP